MHLKTNWLIKVGTVSLTLAMSVVPLAAQRIEIPLTSFAFIAEQRDAARELHTAGVNLFDSGKYAEAEKKFREVVQKYKNNATADRSDYYLIRTLVNLNKLQDALAEMTFFEKEFPRSTWLSDVQEERIRLTRQIPPDLARRWGIAPLPPQAPQPPQPRQPPQASTPPSMRTVIIPGRAPRVEENPEVSLQREVLRVLFENNPDRALEIATDRLKGDPADAVVLSSLYMIAQSRSDKALPLLVTLRVLSQLGSLAAICDVNEAALKELGRQYPNVRLAGTLDEILRSPDIDALVIATPAELHGEMAHQALAAGKHVLVEKPLAVSASMGRTLLGLAEEKGRILMVGHLLWYHPAILKLQEIIRSGVLGRMQYIYSNRLNLGKVRREENILWSFAPHDVSVIIGLAGEMPDAVKAQGGNYLHDQIADVTVSLLSFPSGLKAHLFVSWLHPFKEQKLVIVGDRQMAVFNDLEEEHKLVVYPHNITWKNQLPVVHKAEAQIVPFEPDEPLRAECAHFIECIQTGKRPRTDGEEGLRVLTVLEQCQRALHEEGRNAADAPVVEERSYFAHESAFIDDGTEIGEGTSIWHVSHILKGSRVGRNCKIGQNVVIGPRATVGDGVKIQNNVSVYEGVTLEDHVFCGPSVVFTNVFNPRSEIRRMDELRPTLVRTGASLGANCTVVCGVTIGRYAFVGAGAVVTRDLPDYALAYGAPAKVQGWMCECGVKIEFEADTAECSCGRHYAKRGDDVHRRS